MWKIVCYVLFKQFLLDDLRLLFSFSLIESLIYLGISVFSAVCIIVVSVGVGEGVGVGVDVDVGVGVGLGVNVGVGVGQGVGIISLYDIINLILINDMLI